MTSFTSIPNFLALYLILSCRYPRIQPLSRRFHFLPKWTFMRVLKSSTTISLIGFVFRVKRRFSSLLTMVLITPISRMYLARCFFLPRLFFRIRSAFASLSLSGFFKRLRKSEYMRFRPSLFFRRLSEIAEKYCPRSVPRSSCSLVAIISV